MSSNINLIKALVANLESAHRIASELASAAVNEKAAETSTAISKFLDAISSGSEPAPKKEPEPTAVPQQAVEPAPVPDPVNSCDGILKAMLNDERYTLRSAESLIEKSGFSGDEEDLQWHLKNELGLSIITKTRRSDGETLIGLASRN